jgi:hypothetical protein
MKKVSTLCLVLLGLSFVVFAGISSRPVGTVQIPRVDRAAGTVPARLDTIGDQLAVIFAPVPGDIGVSVAADCRGDLYYTNFRVDTLYKMDASGMLLDRVPIRDAAGAPLTVGEMSWDEGRQMLWAGTDDQAPIKIYLLDPVTGIGTYQFDGMVGLPLTDGIAFDPTDGTIWHSTDISDYIVQFSPAGVRLDTLVPLDAGGNPHGSISGICVGTDNTMYVGHNGLSVITRVDKSTGAFISVFAVPAGRDEGLECDPINFAPDLVLWTKGAYDNSFTAFEVDSGTCVCYEPPDTCELPYEVVDMGDLPQCDYPTLTGNPGHALTDVAWLGTSITGEPAPNILDADPADDGVIFHSIPWTPCEMESVTVTVTAGQMYAYYVEYCSGHLYLNGWKDGNVDGDFCDTLIGPSGVSAPEWIVQDVLVVPGVYTLLFVDPGVFDLGIYDGIFRWRLTSQPVGALGFGLVDRVACPTMTCGTYAFDLVGEVEDYIIEDAQLDVTLIDFAAVPGDREVTLRWSTASETDNDYFELRRNGSFVGRIAGAGTSTTVTHYTWHDGNLHNGMEYIYTLISVDPNGLREELATVNVTPSAEAVIITEYALHQNYPNPFNATTTISFDLVEENFVSLKVYNVLGQSVATIADGRMGRGRHVVAFDAAGVTSGVYIYRLEVGHFVDQKKMLLMK